MNRRSFLKSSMGVAAGLALVGCGSGGGGYDGGGGGGGGNGGATTGGNCLSNGTNTTVSVAHTPNHSVTVPASDILAGAQKTYTLTDAGSGHTHTITVTAADFVNLQNNQGVVLTSTSTGHSHSVTINCA